MQNKSTILITFIFLIVLNSNGLLLVATLSSPVNAQIQELHQETLQAITNQTSPHDTPNIRVGEGPAAIGVNEFTNAIYSANVDDGSISVIDGKNNTKVGKDIKVGSPLGL